MDTAVGTIDNKNLIGQVDTIQEKTLFKQHPLQMSPNKEVQFFLEMSDLKATPGTLLSTCHQELQLYKRFSPLQNTFTPLTPLFSDDANPVSFAAILECYETAAAKNISIDLSILDESDIDDHYDNFYNSSDDQLFSPETENLVAKPSFLRPSMNVIHTAGDKTYYIENGEDEENDTDDTCSTHSSITPPSNSGLESSLYISLPTPQDSDISRISPNTHSNCLPAREEKRRKGTRKGQRHECLEPKLTRIRNLRTRSVTSTLYDKYGALMNAEEPMLCFHCNEPFMNLYSLSEHYEEENLLSRLSYKCPIGKCPFHLIGLNKIDDLRRHVIRFHINQKTSKVKTGSKLEALSVRELVFFCDCRRVFYRKDSLKRHMRLVHGRE